MEIVTLSSKGQVVIPSKVRKKFSLKEGDSLVIIEDEDTICLKPLVNLSDLWGIDTIKASRKMVRDIREEWDNELEKEAAL
jgi:AbrB family looped-hinge helix DNA binding protein